VPRHEHWHPAGYWEWIKVFRGLPLDATTKVVGYALALNADYDTGQNARPGIRLLMQETGLQSDKSVRNALAKLERLGLTERRFKGSSAGRRGLADMYWLALHNEVRIAGGKKPCDCGKT
jgi:hypothetical protein